MVAKQHNHTGNFFSIDKHRSLLAGKGATSAGRLVGDTGPRSHKCVERAPKHIERAEERPDERGRSAIYVGLLEPRRGGRREGLAWIGVGVKAAEGEGFVGILNYASPRGPGKSRRTPDAPAPPQNCSLVRGSYFAARGPPAAGNICEIKSGGVLD